MMTLDQLSKLKRSLILHEGYRNHPYVDSVGKVTIAIGYNLSDRGVSDGWINEKYEEDIASHIKTLSSLPWWSNLNADRQVVLLDMVYNIGFKVFLKFENLIKALEEGNYSDAAKEMLDSTWAQQVKGRALVLAKAMERGIYDV